MAKYVGKTRKRKKRKPKVQMTAAQKKAWNAYKREAKKEGLQVGPKPRRRGGGNMVNEPDPLPEPPRDGPWIQYSEHPKDNMTELRCMVCGAWYRDHRAGEFHKAGYEDGVERVRSLAEAAGNEYGGYKTRGPVLWAMRVLKTGDYIASHYIYHGGTGSQDYRKLKPWENIGTPGVKKESNMLGNEWPHDPLWQDWEGTILTYDERDDVWYDDLENTYDCESDDDGPTCSGKDVIAQAVAAGELEDIPF